MSAASLARVAAAVLASVPLAARGETLSCPGGIVAVGESKLDLLGKCGKPALAEPGRGGTAPLHRRDLGRRVGPPVERWTYDLGKGAFLQVVTIVGGRIAGVERGSYGLAERAATPERPRRSTCDPAALAVGRLKLEVLARCGEPATADAWEEEPASAAGAATVAVELWVYDFGPNQLVRVVRLENGKVTAVETGSYGYSR